MRAEHIHEHRISGHRLGRHLEHDPRSRAHDLAAHLDLSRPLVSKAWTRHCPPFDQGELGSCTGNSAAGLAMTDPLYVPGRAFTEADAVRLYSEGTRLDAVPGVYPPDDTGSTGLAVAKAGKREGLWTHYRHAFTQSAVLQCLSHVGPGMLGIAWYEGFDAPRGPLAELLVSGAVRGGHEIEVCEINVESGYVRGPNSWGDQWGDAGWWMMSFATLAQLLREGGDFTAPLL